MSFGDMTTKITAKGNNQSDPSTCPNLIGVSITRCFILYKYHSHSESSNQIDSVKESRERREREILFVMEDINAAGKKKKNMEETSENSATNQKKIYGDDINKIGNINEQNKNRIQVSNTKKSLFFYLNLAKRYVKQYDDLELSAMGMAIPTAVIIAETLKRNGQATQKHVLISTVGTKDYAKCRIVQKAKIEILLGKAENGREPKINAAAAPKKNYGKMAENGRKREDEEKPKTIAATEP